MQLDPKAIRVDGGTQPRAELLIEVMEDSEVLIPARRRLSLPPDVCLCRNRSSGVSGAAVPSGLAGE